MSTNLIKQEYFTKNGIDFVRTYSDTSMQILQNETRVMYDEAIDLVGRYTYTETDHPIGEEEEDE